MAIAQSKVTAQGQISVPVEVRKKLGVGPGSVLEWHELDGGVVVRRAGRFSSAEIHRALFPKGAPKDVNAVDVKAAIRKYIKKRHAGGDTKSVRLVVREEPDQVALPTNSTKGAGSRIGYWPETLGSYCG